MISGRFTCINLIRVQTTDTDVLNDSHRVRERYSNEKIKTKNRLTDGAALVSRKHLTTVTRPLTCETWP